MIKKIDHLVITTSALDACLSFYNMMGFTTHEVNGRWELHTDTFKINVHILHQELLPKATHVQPGSADLCFEVEQPLTELIKTLQDNGVQPLTDIVLRYGKYGKMSSVYVYDPDGNLIEFCNYN